MMILFIWLVALAATLFLYCRQVYTRFSRYGVKHRPIFPLLGNMGSVLLRKLHLAEFMEELYKENPDDRFIGRFEFVKPVIILRDLELIKRIAVIDSEYFLDHGLSVSQEIDPLFGKILFTLKGQEWKDMRSTLSPAFTSAKIRKMVPFMVEVGNQMMVSLMNQLKKSETDYIDLDCKDIATRFANDVIASCAFGLRVDSHTNPDNEIYKMGRVATDFTFVQILKFYVFTAFPRLNKLISAPLLSKSVRSFFEQLVINTIKEREENGTLRPDMIHLLMEAKKGQLTHEESAEKDEDAGFATVEESVVGRKINRNWSDSELTAQALIFFLAGFETVSTSMTFLMYELAVNPDVQDRLAEEIRAHDKKIGGNFDYDAVQSLTYLDMVCLESLRKWPTAISTDRLCLKDYNLGKPNKEATRDYIIRAGESVKFPIMAIHYDSTYFSDPTKFDPERFSEKNRQKMKRPPYMPFGVGGRSCIGYRFALCEVKVMIYQLLLRIELLPCEKTPIPARLAKGTFTLKLMGGHHLRMKLRE